MDIPLDPYGLWLDFPRYNATLASKRISRRIVIIRRIVASGRLRASSATFLVLPGLIHDTGLSDKIDLIITLFGIGESVFCASIFRDFSR